MGSFQCQNNEGGNFVEGSIIGFNVIVTKNVQSCQLAVGMSAKVVKQEVL